MLPGLIEWQMDLFQSMDGLRTYEELLAAVRPFVLTPAHPRRLRYIGLCPRN